MRKIKILHTADIHFDTPFSGMTSNEAIKNKEELKEVFSDIISIAENEKVDIILMAGDLFDNLSVNKSTLYFIRNSLAKIKDIKVFISPGNHDPYNEKSFYKIIDWPENVYIFKNPYLENVVLEDLETVVWGAAFTSDHVSESIFTKVSRKDGYNNIMVIHGEITNSSMGNEYNPIDIDDIKNSGMDYIALGHRHSFSNVIKSGDTYYSYSGCPQGRGFDELRDKGIVLLELSNRFISNKFIRTSKRNYYQKKINISECFGYNEIKHKIINELDESTRMNDFYKIVLDGEISDEFNINEDILRDLLKEDFYYVKIVDDTKVKIDLDELTKGYSIKSIFTKKMLEMMNNAETEEEKEEIMLALKIGIQSLSTEEVRIYED